MGSIWIGCKRGSMGFAYDQMLNINVELLFQSPDAKAGLTLSRIVLISTSHWSVFALFMILHLICKPLLAVFKLYDLSVMLIQAQKSIMIIFTFLRLH